MMKTKNTLEYVSMIYGILVTLFMLLAIVPKLIEEFIKEGFGFLIEIRRKNYYKKKLNYNLYFENTSKLSIFDKRKVHFSN